MELYLNTDKISNEIIPDCCEKLTDHSPPKVNDDLLKVNIRGNCTAEKGVSLYMGYNLQLSICADNNLIRHNEVS